MNIIRKVLLSVQARNSLTPQEVVLEGEDPLVVGHHVEMLFQAGYLDATTYKLASIPYLRVMVRDLTWEGHDFVAALSNDTVWGKIKSAFQPSELATLPLQVVKEAGVAALKQWTMQQLGL